MSYPGIDAEARVPFDRLVTACQRIFHACGMRGDDAALLADTLGAADVRGVHSHGVLRVPDYVGKLLDEGVDPQGRPRVVWDTAGAIVVDGGNSMGQVGSAFGMRVAIARAKDTAVAAAVVRGSNHAGAMAYYAMMRLPEDMIGIAATNALPTMAPWGGVDKILGINPIGRHCHSRSDRAADRVRRRLQRLLARQDPHLPLEGLSDSGGVGLRRHRLGRDLVSRPPRSRGPSLGAIGPAVGTLGGVVSCERPEKQWACFPVDRPFHIRYRMPTES